MGRKNCIKTKHLITLLLIFGVFTLYCSFNRSKEGFFGGSDDDKDDEKDGKKSFECDDEDAECDKTDKIWACDEKKRKCVKKKEKAEKKRIATEWLDDVKALRKEQEELWEELTIIVEEVIRETEEGEDE